MDQAHSLTLLQLQELRLLRAFARIDEAAERLAVIELAERLAKGVPVSPSSTPTAGQRTS